MRKVILGMQMSLNGFIAGVNGDMSWVDVSDETWKHNFEAFDSVDTVLIGRVLYEGFMQYWPAAGKDPKATKYDRKYMEWIEKTKKCVFTRTLKNAAWNNSEIMSGTPAEEVAKLKSLPGKNILLAGGANLAIAFAKENLIDEYQLLVVPRAIGAGITFLGGIPGLLKLKLLSVKKLSTGTIAVHYART
jgi:dihydrofolate reductase